MSAIAGRRRRSTIIASVAAAGCVLAAAVLVAAGSVALLNSTDGADASDDRPEVNLPATPNGVLLAVDDEGNLASAAVVTLRPSGTGGSVVGIPVSADVSSGNGRERLPLAETAQLDGVEAVPREVENLLRVDIGEHMIADAAQLRRLLAPIGDLDVDLPLDVVDAHGDVVAEAGRQTLTPAEAAAVLTARDPDVPAVEQYPAALAVWSAVSAAIGDGATAGAAGDGAAAAEPGGAAPTTFAGLFDRVTAGRVGTRGLTWADFDADRNPRKVDVVNLDQAEVSLVFGQVSPGQVSAAYPSLTFRLESRFGDDQLGDGDPSNADVAYAALLRLLYAKANVISVDTKRATAPDVTTIYIANESMRASIEQVAPASFGDVDVQVADTRIAGIDVVIQLGESYLAELERRPSAPDGSAAGVAAEAESTTPASSTLPSTTPTTGG